MDLAPHHIENPCPSLVQWSPRKMLVATAGQALQLWVPDMRRLEELRQHPNRLP